MQIDLNQIKSLLSRKRWEENAQTVAVTNSSTSLSSGNGSNCQYLQVYGWKHLHFSSDQPSPPASQPVVSRLSTHSLVLSWTGPSYDGGTAVLGYIVEVRQEGPDKPGSWTEISRSKNTSYHVRSGLEPLGLYRFRVRAYNSAGISEPSQESESVKMATASEWHAFSVYGICWQKLTYCHLHICD